MVKSKTPARSIDVAKLAGVSRSAVSRTFTTGTYVSEKTREKVLEAARALDYSPNVIARSLSKRSTRIVGIAMTDLQNNFYAHLLEELLRAPSSHLHKTPHQASGSERVTDASQLSH